MEFIARTPALQDMLKEILLKEGKLYRFSSDLYKENSKRE